MPDTPPTLNYQTPDGRASRRFLRPLAVLSASVGLLLTGLFIFGLKFGPTALVEPPVGTLWFIPFFLILWPLGLLCGKLLDRWHKRGLEQGL